MDRKNQFDEQLKEKLSQHSEQAPADAWEKIVAQRGKRRSGYWRLGWTLLLLMLVGAGIYVVSESRKEQASQSVNIGHEEKNKISSSASTMPEGGRSKAEVPSQNQKAQLNGELQNHVGNQSNKQTSQTENMGSSKRAPDARLQQAKSTTASASKKSKNEANTNDETAHGNSTATDETTNTNNNAPKSTGGSVNADTANSKETTANTETTEANQPATSQAPEQGAAGLTSQTPDESTPTTYEIKDSLKQEAKKDSTVTPHLKKHSLSVELYILPEHATKDLEEKASMQASDYLNLRKESETIDNAFSAGTNLRYEINDRYFIKAGIRYSVINETFYFKQAAQEAVPSLDTIIRGYVVDPFLPPVPLYKYDTSYTYKTVYADHAAHNHYNFIDIPVSAGIQFKLKRFDFYLSAGIELNVLVYANGTIIGQDTTGIIDLSSEKTPFNKTSISFISGLGCAYHLSHSFEIFLEPEFRKQLTSMTKDEYHWIRNTYA